MLAVLALCSINAISAQATAPRRRVERDLVIDGQVNHLTRLSWIGVSPQGVLVAVQSTDRAIRFFGSDGKPTGTLTADATKLQRAGSAGWVGDTLWVNDNANFRAVLMSAAPGVLATRPSSPDIILPSGEQSPFGSGGSQLTPLPAALLADGAWILRGLAGAGSPAAWHRPADPGSAYVRVAPNGTLRRFLGWAENSSAGCTLPAPGGVSVALPACVGGLTAIAPDGNLFVVARGRTAGPDSGILVITAVKANGDTVYSKRLAMQTVPISSHDADSIVNQRLSLLASQPEAQQAFRTYHPTIYPVANAIVVAADGTAWIEESSEGADRSWLILDSTGTPWGRVAVPRGARIQVADKTTAWATEVGADGSTNIIRFKIQ